MNEILNKKTKYIDLGLMDYQQAWDYQTNLFQSILDVKVQNRSLPVNEQLPTHNYLLFCEHPHVFTLGKSGEEKNLLVKKQPDRSKRFIKHLAQVALALLVAQTRAKWGKIDVLVCNAAINPVFGSMSQISDEAFDKIMGANVRSNHQLCNLVIPEMVERKDGSVIIVSSIGGLRGSPVLGAYCISKAADFQLARNIAVEFGIHNVRANCIAPGLIKTDFAKALWDNPAILERSTSTSPLKRIGDPDEIAGAAVFLASKAAAFMTGQTLVVDGGVTI